MTFVLVGRVQAEYPLAKGLFLPKALLKNLSNLETTANTVSATRRNCVFLQFIFQTNLYKTKYRRTRPFTKESPVLFITRRK